ncbi:hypothetical protein SanaruYs_34550 [Chryseotalea sanaruensis]|uniref:DNA repair helicase n=1 Tax=Chryseotalea sanaruensis TaxID=2482724 RepID=A0A401UEC5_9BACT|nr:DEAD/DEAH box helicase family protein [Chryseotalea sanaruensis]GCC53212.1 hypothetical protein SanaruYs_34550 [Chryseotalea sanaruensis]
MLKQINWPSNRTFRSGDEIEPIQFYLNCLCNSKHLDLLLGYFSSGAVNILALGFAKFLYSGGKVRMVINNVLSEKDKEAIEKGQAGVVDNKIIDINNIKELKRSLNDYGHHFFECLAWLIANNKISIKIIKPKNRDGISHYKSGMFSDELDSIGFKASCNFTAFGLAENLEELDSFFEWEDNRSSQWVNSQNKYFQEIFSGSASFVQYLTTENVIVAITKEFLNKDINELVIQEKELLERKAKLLGNKKVRSAFEKVIIEIEEIIREPRFPYPEGARDYQNEAYKKWVSNGQKGIFAMATGTGKTITSLNCVLKEYKKSNDKHYRVLILVPTITLVDQWEKEARSFNFKEVFKVTSKVSWEHEITTLLSTSKRIPVSFILITTYSSFIKQKFQSLVDNLPSDTIFIADEGHNLASPKVSSLLKNFSLNKRIGLSATPKRIYDVEGTEKMEEFFSDKEPYTYSFSMERAIREGVLCEYKYFPKIIELMEDELEGYIQLSDRLAKLYKYKKSDDNTRLIEMLLLERKRIIHKAKNKLPAVVKILKDQISEKGNLKYTFVYVPEGEAFEINENVEERLEENIKIINQYTRAIGRIDDKILVNEFISGMKNRDEILDQFQEGHIDVIASMKCLDEGVDIPRAETAIFCSSTGNPRQFIQRRGRILRKHKDKRFASIHDLIVIPKLNKESGDTENYNLERSLVRTELERVMYFASLSKNPYYTEDTFSEVCKKYNLNIYNIQKELASI